MLLTVTTALANDTRLVVSVTGDVSADNKILTLSLEPGEIATHAIRVYSEPSHTLLVAVVDSELGKESDSWQSSWFEVDRPLALVTTDLPGGMPRVHVAGRPETDDRIAVYVYGTWPDGTVGETLISDAKVGQRSFAFSTSLVVDNAKEGDVPRVYEHCCQGDNCSKMCMMEGCCWIECGWDNPRCTPNC
jgi:hypothetical protein